MLYYYISSSHHSSLYPSSSILQTVVTMINHAIGASGVVSQQCKAVVEQYGQTIMDMLLAEVSN